MKKLIKYVMLDILRNRIVIGYTLLLLIISLGVFNLEDNTSKGLLTLLNIVLIVVPLVSIIFSTIYVFNASEFIELLVSQPLKRTTLFGSIYTGLSSSLLLAVAIGIGLPVLIYEPSSTGWILVLSGMVLTSIFVSLAMLASVLTRDKAKGIGAAMLIWFYFAIIYDALVLFILFQFADYPLENASIALTALNPIDLSRILVILKMDISAMMGYTGAVFKDFFHGFTGHTFIAVVLLTWLSVPIILALKKFSKKDL